jgi:hypothetical protein
MTKRPSRKSRPTSRKPSLSIPTGMTRPSLETNIERIKNESVSFQSQFPYRVESNEYVGRFKTKREAEDMKQIRKLQFGDSNVKVTNVVQSKPRIDDIYQKDGRNYRVDEVSGNNVFVYPQNSSNLLRIPRDEFDKRYTKTNRTQSRGEVVTPTKMLSQSQRKRVDTIKKNKEKAVRGDQVEGAELEMWLDNTQSLYNQKVSVLKNLDKKKEKGTYNSDGALLAFKNLADASAKSYEQEFKGTKFNQPSKAYSADLMRKQYEAGGYTDTY